MNERNNGARRHGLVALIGAMWLVTGASACEWPGDSSSGNDNDGSGGVPQWANPLENLCLEEGDSTTIDRRLTCSRGELQSGDTECVYYIAAPKLDGSSGVINVTPAEPHVEHGGEDVGLTINAGYLSAGTVLQDHALQGTVRNCRSSTCTPHGLNARIRVAKPGHCPP